MLAEKPKVRFQEDESGKVKHEEKIYNSEEPTIMENKNKNEELYQEIYKEAFKAGKRIEARAKKTADLLSGLKMLKN